MRFVRRLGQMAHDATRQFQRIARWLGLWFALLPHRSNHSMTTETYDTAPEPTDALRAYWMCLPTNRQRLCQREAEPN